MLSWMELWFCSKSRGIPSKLQLSLKELTFRNRFGATRFDTFFSINNEKFLTDADQWSCYFRWIQESMCWCYLISSEEWGARRNSAKAQQSRHDPRSGPEIKNGSAENDTGKAQMRDNLEGGKLDSAVEVCKRCKNSPSVLSCISKRTKEGCNRGSEVGKGPREHVVHVFI